MAKKRTRRPPSPKALALVACDSIHRDPGTGKAYIMGCFANIVAQSFPVTVPGIAVYAVVTDGHGKVPIKIVLVDADEERDPVHSSTFQVDFPDPRIIVEVIGHMPGLKIPQPGEYRLQIFAWDDCLVERRILVTPPVPAGGTSL